MLLLNVFFFFKVVVEINFIATGELLVQQDRQHTSH